MPKASQSFATRSSVSLSSTIHPNVLKRNQACHQCRRRKLVSYNSDAKRPCSTCVRSHAHAVSHAPPGANLPTNPECTFDDVVETNTTTTDGPKTRYERLENRINELESLLRQKEHSAPGSPVELSSRSLMPDNFGGPSSAQITGQDFSSFSSVTNVTPSPPMVPEDTVGLDIIWPNWPSAVPGPDLLRHLVDVFFTFHPHATRLFHAATFIRSLSLPPSHPKFPSTPVLHAICALGSLYTVAVSSPPLPNFDEVAPDEIFLERHRSKEQRPDSFAEQQAKLARDTAAHLNSLGEDLFQVLQANIILSWFYWSHSRYILNVFLCTAHSMRLSVPLGLNMCPPFHSISKSERPPSILSPARTVIEDETRRNAFWLAYAAERQHGCGNGWAMSLDDQDVSQLLPVRGDQFEQGVLVTPLERQWAHTRDALLVHSENQTDSFILYVKGTIMISRVKAFNLRFRARHFAGDASVTTPHTESFQMSDRIDPRGSQAFIELDHIVSSFRASFPSHLRNPIVNNVVDNHLYTVCLMPHVATIVLHDPHAEVRQSGCISALKILTAARAILDLIYNVWSTSFDITLLDSFCSFCWFVGGRVLVRFLQAAIDAKSEDQISTLRAELDFVQRVYSPSLSAIAKVGQRVPLAFRFAKMLEDLIRKRCDPSPIGPSAQLTFPRPLQSPHLHSLFEEIYHSNSNITLQESIHEPGSFVSLA
ncbi:hypothetical protein BDQ12DRAFT_600361 [Crucibulum laeve]|uniref:Xylanolytic transcriptional activator regulatory domain-containing protein n=1 Tax=Crucibulum laeve TaxID=68775 RepID=A0A5C3M6V9_9AGAR|nr:hypothetical protein BDQ12DRAFT_600361 [Crucibulum laeve]